jgi:hypothetical protein
VDHPWLVVSLSLLFKSCISFHIRVVYDVEKEKLSKELLGGGSTFVKRKKTNCLPLLSKGKHRCISPPIGILLYNCPSVIIDLCIYVIGVE